MQASKINKMGRGLTSYSNDSMYPTESCKPIVLKVSMKHYQIIIKNKNIGIANPRQNFLESTWKILLNP